MASEQEATEGTYSPPLPVTPLPELLPLADPNLPWARFEAFCRDLIFRLPGVEKAYVYGKPGDTQRGVDVIAELEDGTRWAFQCRQRKKVSVTQFDKAVKDTTYEADRYFLVASCVVGARVRDAAERLPTWDVWDVRDLSAKVRELPTAAAGAVVKTHFGVAWRTAFLGLSGDSPLVSSEEFFAPYMDPTRLFNHSWALVGRAEPLAELESLVAGDQYSVAIVKGRGGIGKTKILHAFAERLSGTWDVWLLLEGMPITLDCIAQMSDGPCVVIVDDAHRREDLDLLIAIARRRNVATKLVLSTRLYGEERLLALLAQGGFDSREMLPVCEIKELDREDVTDLARQALGRRFQSHAEQLAAVTWDCPLVTLVGGRMIAEKKIPTDLLERDHDFRRAVLTRFTDVLVGAVGDKVAPETCKSILQLIAAISPVGVNNEAMLVAVSNMLGLERPALIQTLGNLEEAGVLIRRGYTLRITPDVLADHILNLACLTAGGDTTGYAESVWEVFVTICAGNVLRNFAELDWRMRATDAQSGDVLARIWSDIRTAFEDGNSLARWRVLKMLEPSAYYQADRVLDLIEHALRAPVSEEGDSASGQTHQYTHGDVLEQAAAVLRPVSYVLNQLPRCADLLWEIGQDDSRPLNQSPNHAIRILQDLASYQPSKPLMVNEGVLVAAEKWLARPDCHIHLHSPLDVIDPLLAKSGYSTQSSGHQVTFSPFLVNEENTRELRRRALAAITQCGTSTDTRVAVRAVQSLEQALRGPEPLFEMKISDDEMGLWNPEQLRVLGAISDVAKQTSSSIVQIEIKKSLRRQAKHGFSESVKARATEIIDSVADSYELRLTRFLMEDWFHDVEPEDSKNPESSYAAYDARMAEERNDVATRFAREHPDARDAINELAERLEAIETSGTRPQSRFFMLALADLDAKYATEMCDALIEAPIDPVSRHFSAFLASSRRLDALAALKIADRAVRTKDAALCLAVAERYTWNDWAETAFEGELHLIRRLLRDDDMWIRRTAVSSLAPLGRVDSRAAIELALKVEVGEATVVANALATMLQAGFGVPCEELSDDEIRTILRKLSAIPELNDHAIQNFIKFACTKCPKDVVKLLLDRVDDFEGKGSGYAPVPYLGFRHALETLPESTEYEGLLRQIRNHKCVGNIGRFFWLPRLYSTVSSGFGPTSLRVLGEWIDSGDRKKLEGASNLLQDAGQELVLENVEFVANFIERAHALGETCYRKVAGALEGAAVSGTSSGTPGVPMPREVARRDRAREVASKYPIGSPVRKFYTDLSSHAESSIADQLAR